MINVMLVDDDHFFRSMFSNLINWREHGCILICQAENGQQAIEYLNQKKIDLVFTDMNMPLVDGVQLIDYISSYMPHIKYVSLSSYDDFSYVKGSLTHGAIDYILKHMMTRHDLEKILENFKKTYDSSLEEKINIVTTQDLGQMQSGFLVGLLEGTYASSTDIPTILKAISLPDISKNILLFQLSVNDFDQIKTKYKRINKFTQLMKTLVSIMQSISDRLGNGIVFTNECNHKIYTLLSANGFEDVHFAEYSAQLYMKQVSNSLSRYLNLEVSLVAAPVCRDIKDIHCSYLYILKELKQPLPAHSVNQKNEVKLPKFYERELKYYLHMDDFQPLKDSIVFFYNEARKKEQPLASFAELTILLFNTFISLDAQMKTLLHEDHKMKTSEINKILDLDNDRDLQEHILSVFKKLHLAFNEKDKEVYSPIVYMALKIIHNQYYDCSLSLNAIAEIIHVNPSYLSRIFKVEKGIGLMDYINMFRVARSTDLLIITNLTVKHIAKKCGFDNYNYFFRVFKKYTNLTPNEFRAQTETLK